MRLLTERLYRGDGLKPACALSGDQVGSGVVVDARARNFIHAFAHVVNPISEYPRLLTNAILRSIGDHSDCRSSPTFDPWTAPPPCRPAPPACPAFRGCPADPACPARSANVYLKNLSILRVRHDAAIG